MERDCESIQAIIKQIIALLCENDEQEWAEYLNRIVHDLGNLDTRMSAIRNLSDIYKGGMGSFTDLVLQKNYKMLVEENNKLADLKHELYNVCLEYHTKYQ